MDAAMIAPRLHQVNPTKEEKLIATPTPSRTLTIRRAVSAIVPTRVTWTMSSAVRAAVTGRLSETTSTATRYDATAAPVNRRARLSAAGPRSRARLRARRVARRSSGTHDILPPPGLNHLAAPGLSPGAA